MNDSADVNPQPDRMAITAPLMNRTFRSVWLSTQVSSLGWLVQTVAVSWLLVTTSASDVMVSLVQASATLPTFILSVFAGAIADNFSHRGVMLMGRCVIAVAFAILSCLLAAGITDSWTILGLSFAAGCGVAFNGPAWQASVGDLVKRREIPAAVMLISIGFNTVRSVGPALGGITVATLGPMAAMVIATLASVAPIWVLWRHRWNVQASTFPREPLLASVYDGVRFTAMSSDLKTPIMRATLLGIAGAGVLALLPLVARDQLGGNALSYGILMAGFGTGAFLAGFSNSKLRRFVSQERVIAIACLACALSSASLALTSSLGFAATLLGFGGAGWVLAWCEFGVSVQLASPRWVVGRTLAIYYASTSGGIAAGSWLWGTIAEHYSLARALGCSAGALLLVAITGYLRPMTGSEHVEAEPVERTDIPELPRALVPQSGPIVVRIDYLIEPTNLKAFMHLMAERRRRQSCIGARHWRLQWDLEESSRWIENFELPTWTAYLRLHHRLTAADTHLNDHLVALHAAECPPIVSLAVERPARTASRKFSLPFNSHS